MHVLIEKVTVVLQKLVFFAWISGYRKKGLFIKEVRSRGDCPVWTTLFRCERPNFICKTHQIFRKL